MVTNDSKNDAHNIAVAEAENKPKRSYNRKPVAINQNGEEQDTSIAAPNAALNEKFNTQFPEIPAGFVWRVAIEEDAAFGTCYIVGLFKKSRFSAKRIDSIKVAANQYSQFYQGTTLSDPETLAKVAHTLWATRRDAIERKVNYSTRAHEMKRYVGDYDADHLLSEK